MWDFAPQFGDLKTVQGGFVTGLGKFKASWPAADGRYQVSLQTPGGPAGD